jgi:YD repeat-containing protein
MADGYSRSPRLLKGAIIQFSAPMLVPIPNLIVFQYNPETLTRRLTPWAPLERERDEQGELVALTDRQTAALAQPYDPDENLSVELELDATDALEDPGAHPVAAATGVADRVAALEMLLYPPQDSALGNLLGVSLDVSIGAGGVSVTTGAAADLVKRRSVPVVLFFWGPGRIVPVRITSFAVEEQAFSPVLYPLRARVSLGMRVLDENDLVNIEGEEGPNTASVKIARACYTFTRTQKELLAMANLANSVKSIAGMLPF